MDPTAAFVKRYSTGPGTFRPSVGISRTLSHRSPKSPTPTDEPVQKPQRKRVQKFPPHISNPIHITGEDWTYPNHLLKDIDTMNATRSASPETTSLLSRLDAVQETEIIPDFDHMHNVLGSQARKLKLKKLLGLSTLDTSSKPRTSAPLATQKPFEKDSTSPQMSVSSVGDVDTQNVDNDSLFADSDNEDVTFEILNSREVVMTPVGPGRRVSAIEVPRIVVTPTSPPGISPRDTTVGYFHQTTRTSVIIEERHEVICEFPSRPQPLSKRPNIVKMGGEYFPPGSKIINNHDIFEEILDYLPTKDLLLIQRTSRAFQKAITGSKAFQEKLHNRPAAIASGKLDRLNPLLTSTGNVSVHHPIHYLLKVDECLSPDRRLILAHNGRFYEPESFFNSASNPSLAQDANGHAYLQWQLRELSQMEALDFWRYVIVQKDPSGVLSSVWGMNLCQPPPTEVHVTVWKKEGAVSTVSEKIIVRAWTVREILDKMDEARNGVFDEYLRPSSASSTLTRSSTSVQSLTQENSRDAPKDLTIRPKDKNLMTKVAQRFKVRDNSPTANLGAYMMGMGGYRGRLT